MKVKMYPHPDDVKGMSGIDQVVMAYAKHLPALGVEIAHPEDPHFDLVAGHVGQGATLDHPFVCHIHGLHWTGDYPCEKWQYYVNSKVIHSIRLASEVTVPSTWVAETFQRDMRFTPHVIPHGIDADDWLHDEPQGDYVLWNKNRAHDVCDASPVIALARKFTKQHFFTTFMPRGATGMSNVNVLNGIVPHAAMKRLVQSCLVYLSTVKETFGIGTLEAMAAGRPVLGFDYGGNSPLIDHGVNGYLAKPGNFDDLAEGLRYCIEHRETLGKNGMELARQWTWQAACEQVRAVYENALTPEPPTVAVVIPHYNIGVEKLGRAIASARTQDCKTLNDIVVVDDNSVNQHEVASLVISHLEQDARVRVIAEQFNQGVAMARNIGIRTCDNKYIACLDADDAIHPEFIERCVQALEADRSLGIAYTGLWSITPDGREGLSRWPGDWDYDAHTNKQNQVPTCCVFRRSMWERLGGYRARYCPDGAGEEDAEYFLRAGAYGYKARKVDNRGLFLYSHKSGTVSGNPNHQVSDWTAWHPWAGQDGDGLHPFASYATPKVAGKKPLLSHPVRQYDQPTISVVIPVGPGHEKHVIDALDSLEAQTFRRWEAVVVWDCEAWNGGDEIVPKLKRIMTTYPYARYLFTSAPKQGAGRARNFGASKARAPLVLFLDADDWLYPTALEKMLHAWNEHQHIIYTDYQSRSIVTTKYMNEQQAKGRFLKEFKSWTENDQKVHYIASADEAFDYDCKRAILQPQQDSRDNVYVWCNVTALIPLAWHQEIGGFDESLKSWEDVDYHWRLAKAGKCYTRVPERLMVYNFHKGHRRESGRQNYKNLLYYLGEKHKGVETVGCSGCGGRRSRSAARATSPFAAANSQRAAKAVSDDDFILCRYMGQPPGNRSNRQVTGPAVLDKEFDGWPMIRRRSKPLGWSINYGVKCADDVFPVHYRDVEVAPALFIPVEQQQAVAVPAVEEMPLTEPEPVVSERADGVVDLRDSAVDMGELSMPPVSESSKLAELLDNVPGMSPELDTKQSIVDDILADVEPEMPQVSQPPVFELQKIPGVSAGIAKQMNDDDVTTKAQILALGVEGLVKYKGVAENRAGMILRAVSGE